MNKSQRVSRGFHRLAVLLASVILLVGAAMSVYPIVDGLLTQKRMSDAYPKRLALLSCARDAIYKKLYADMPRDVFDRKVKERLRSEGDAVLPPWTHIPAPWDNPCGAGASAVCQTFTLSDLGCPASYDEPETASAREIFAPRKPSLVWTPFLNKSALRLAVTFILSLAVYSIVAAIGWVISGFMAP